MADMKQYIISFKATLQGHKMVLTQLKGMERQVKGVGKVTEKAGKQTQSYGQQMGKLAKRALMVIPVWLLLRSVMMTVMRTFGDMVRAFIDLDDQLARIRTVMHGNAEEIDAEMIAIKRQIIDTSLKSRIAIKSLAEGFYFLKTANLDATEAMAAFAPTVDLAIGTMNSMGESARAVAGIYNTMGQYLDENLTVHEKFQHIADVLAYTYSTQDVQLSELIQSYTKLAPYITGLSDSFLELTTMLGFLNTRLLRSGRTGRLTGRAILQLTKNAKKLSGIFDITFDPDAPIAFLETIGKIRNAMKVTGKLTAEQGDIIQQVFATRAGVVIRLLIEHWDDLSEQIKDAIENVDGFANKMKEIRMDTIAGQMERMKNVLAVLMDDFLATAYGAKNLADAVKLFNSALEATRPVARGTGHVIAVLGAGFRENYYWVRAFTEAMKEMPTGGMPVSFGIGVSIPQLRRAGELLRQYREQDIKGIEETQKAREGYLKNEEKIKTLTLEQSELYGEITKIASSDKPAKQKEEEVKKIQNEIDLKQKLINEILPAEQKEILAKKKATEDVSEVENEILGRRNLQIQNEKHQIKLMKILGASALDISRKELEILETYLGQTTGLEDELELAKKRNKVTEEEVKYRQQITDVFMRTEINLLKVIGGSEIQILELREKQIRAKAKSRGIDVDQLKILNIRIEQQQVLLKEKIREVNVARNLALSYEKADMFQKGRIRRAMELTALETDEIVARYKNDVFDRGVILDYWSSFRKEAQNAILEAVHQWRNLPGDAPKLEAEDLLPEDSILKYAQKYKEEMFKSVDAINERFRAGMPTFGATITTPPVGAGQLSPPEPEVPRIDLRQQLKNMEIQLERGKKEEKRSKELKEYNEKQTETNLKLDRLIEVTENAREDTVEGLDKVEEANKETGRKVGEI